MDSSADSATMNANPEESSWRRRKIYPDGMAIEPREILHDDTESSSCSHETNQARQQQGCEGDAPATADLFVTMVSSASANLAAVFPGAWLYAMCLLLFSAFSNCARAEQCCVMSLL